MHFVDKFNNNLILVFSIILAIRAQTCYKSLIDILDT